MKTFKNFLKSVRASQGEWDPDGFLSPESYQSLQKALKRQIKNISDLYVDDQKWIDVNKMRFKLKVKGRSSSSGSNHEFDIKTGKLKRL